MVHVEYYTAENTIRTKLLSVSWLPDNTVYQVWEVKHPYTAGHKIIPYHKLKHNFLQAQKKLKIYWDSEGRNPNLHW